MKNKTWAFLTVLLVLASFLGLAYWKRGEPKTTRAKPTTIVFHSPTCECCQGYVAYLKREGFKVEQKEIEDMLSIKEKYEIPPGLESCHTSLIENYFVEGHVPLEAIEKLLKEKPKIEGIALPGMPPGSPGMGGFKMKKWTISALSQGRISNFLTL